MADKQVTGVVHDMFQSILAELGETFSQKQLEAEVAYRRVRPLRIKYVALPPGTTGGCLALKDVDLIVIRTRLEPLRMLFTELHECAHLLFGHAPVYDQTYQEFLEHPDLQVVVNCQRTTAYDNPLEGTVELLATLCLERIMRHEEQKRENSAPRHLWDLYG